MSTGLEKDGGTSKGNTGTKKVTPKVNPTSTAGNSGSSGTITKPVGGGTPTIKSIVLPSVADTKMETNIEDSTSLKEVCTLLQLKEGQHVGMKVNVGGVGDKFVDFSIFYDIVSYLTKQGETGLDNLTIGEVKNIYTKANFSILGSSAGQLFANVGATTVNNDFFFFDFSVTDCGRDVCAPYNNLLKILVGETNFGLSESQFVDKDNKKARLKGDSVNFEGGKSSNDIANAIRALKSKK